MLHGYTSAAGASLVSQEEHHMATSVHRPRSDRTAPTALHPEQPPDRKPAGRPPGPPSTIVNVRLPLALLARLDRYIDRLESCEGVKANRGSIARQALKGFLEPHAQ